MLPVLMITLPVLLSALFSPVSAFVVSEFDTAAEFVTFTVVWVVFVCVIVDAEFTPFWVIVLFAAELPVPVTLTDDVFRLLVMLDVALAFPVVTAAPPPVFFEAEILPVSDVLNAEVVTNALLFCETIVSEVVLTETVLLELSPFAVICVSACACGIYTIAKIQNIHINTDVCILLFAYSESCVFCII
jgi:hypothetical protein